MFYDDPLHETPARRDASGEAQDAYAVAVYNAAVARREHDAGAETLPPDLDLGCWPGAGIPDRRVTS